MDAFRKSLRKSNLNQKPSSILYRQLKNKYQLQLQKATYKNPIKNKSKLSHKLELARLALPCSNSTDEVHIPDNRCREKIGRVKSAGSEGNGQ
jgi:hypothetical protein